MSPGPARSLTVHGIAEAGVALADGGGLDAVTMRSVARAVGTTAPALYRYVASREELIGRMVDVVSAALDHPDPSGDWLKDVLAVAEQQVALHRAHPWLAAASALPSPLGPHVLDHVEWVIAVLTPVGAPGRAVMEAVALTNGAAALFAGAGPSPGPELFRDLEPDRQPGLAALLAGAAPGPPSDDLFRRVLTGILTAMLDAPASR
ncbi:TetR/AcrR family transcriptional regulator [Actinomycetospora callitridis]|uniref:TetR/AcrR family transcriptional regulator n=1 Tax=Actinomycetospora callitridis TaxID=913944 RepID=UPI00236528A9|nr:TetR/AcrR family transcriptional regulator [Actinomycetospora callitridis]MDD7921634.1 helix-turn-helix domain containing protein [Actinomycetospora callitridis]